MKVIAIASTAGGVGKTTLAHCLAVAFAEFGKKTLLIDLDPAGALTFRLGYESPRISITDFLNGVNLNESNLESTAERFDFIPADSRLVSAFESSALSNLLANLPKNYDAVILDIPASISQTLSLAISICHQILVPVRANLHSARGFLQIKKSAQKTPVCAVLISAEQPFSPGALLSQVIDTVDFLDEAIYESSEIEISALKSLSILNSSKDSQIAESYRSVAYSVLELVGLE